MSFGLHDTHGRHRRRVRRTLARWLIGLGAIVAAGVVAYETGSSLAEREVEELGQRLAAASDRVEELERQNTDLQASLILKDRRLKDVEQLYDRDVPSGALATLMGRIREKLEAGVDLSRFEFLIEAAGKPRACDNKPVTKRFMVRTPISRAANDSVSFAKNRITITALGESALNAEGKVEAWFDPARSIALRFTQIGGKTTVEKGKLPLHTSVIVDDNEYKYSVVAGAQRGFVEVTGERCDFP
jgi:hypothetical protein